VHLRKNAKVSLLARVPLFERCSKRDLAKIASIARDAEYPSATPVVREGQVGDEFFVIVEGEVDVRKGARKLATLRAGNFFGEIALITGSPRTATVTTGTPIRALVITRRDFRRLLDDAPDLQFKLLQEIGKRLEQLASAQAPQRIRLRY
jgi:CRP/FNR family transcriptional regulator, cyclic AMP receptor protein